LNIILECLLKWFAPIFVFTTEEIFNLVNKNEKSIHETVFPEIPQNWMDEELKSKWKELFLIKQEVNIAIEEKRTNKEIGSSLEANVQIYVNKKKFKLLENLDLEEYFIASKVEKISTIANSSETIISVSSLLLALEPFRPSICSRILEMRSSYFFTLSCAAATSSSILCEVPKIIPLLLNSY
jgi:isoleucyl-tRNA synthetase